MAEYNEQEIQEMIRKAREGDAEANFRMSEWALEQAMAEPEEERWNRLAAKCLVKSAEAGYEPAKKRMDELIRQLEEEKSAPADQEIPPAAQEPAPRPAAAEPAEEPRSTADTLRAAAAGAKAFFGKAAAFAADLLKKPEDDGGDEESDAPSARAETPAPARPRHTERENRTRAGAKHAGGLASYFNFSSWGDAQWKKAQKIALIVLIAVVLLVVILLLAGKKEKVEEPEPEPQIPAAATTIPLPTATPAPTIYPDETLRSAIAASAVEVKPDDAEYVTEATTATVKTNGGVLYMRKGNGTNYDRIDAIPNGTSVEVFAIKGGWSLVRYKDAYGWCSGDYLK